MYFKMPVIHFNPVDNYEAKTTDYMFFKNLLNKFLLFRL